ncbi:MAG: hypothetical protein ACI909_002030 [Planctomycetota bacterium]|jgi:hypothetical protein
MPLSFCRHYSAIILLFNLNGSSQNLRANKNGKLAKSSFLHVFGGEVAQG